MGLPSAWTAAAALPITSSSNGSGAVSSTRRSTSKPTRTWPRRGKVSPPTSSSTTTNDCIRRWLTAPPARSSTKQRHLPVRRGGKTLARAQHYQHNEMQTWAGFLTLRSPDRCLEDRVHLTRLARLGLLGKIQRPVITLGAVPLTSMPATPLFWRLGGDIGPIIPLLA